MTVWTTTLWNHAMPQLQWGVVIGASLVAAAIDLRTRRIPNLLTVPLLVAGWVCAVVLGSFAGLADAAAASFLLGLPFVLLFTFAGGGAGDAKLMAALGAWLGVLNGTVVLVAVLLSGALVAVAYALATRQVRSVMNNLMRIASNMVILALARKGFDEQRHGSPKTSDMQSIPYAVAIFMGSCIAAGGLFLWRD